MKRNTYIIIARGIGVRLILLLNLLLLFKPIVGQKENNSVKKNIILNINTPDGYARITVLSKKSKKKVQNNRLYFWYAYGKVMSTMGGYDGRLLNGEFACFYDNNNLKEKGCYRKGLKIGKWKEWFENGNIKEESNWRNGLRNGLVLTYNEDGVLESEINYKNGLYHGAVVQYQSGQIISKKYYKKGTEYIPKSHNKDSIDNKTPIPNNNQGQPDKSDGKIKIFQKIKDLFIRKKKDNEANDSTSFSKPQP